MAHFMAKLSRNNNNNNNNNNSSNNLLQKPEEELSISVQELDSLLYQVPSFGYGSIMLNNNEWLTLWQNSHKINGVPKNKVLIQINQPNFCLFKINTGKVDVLDDNNKLITSISKQNSIINNYNKKKNIFGLPSFLSGSPSRYSVVSASEDLSVHVLSRNTIYSLLNDDPTSMSKFFAYIAFNYDCSL
eukprot:TRINITY_DN15778_c0_g1_i1.p1 TRINITY_DN15778_c0_g1~~TRINITY_DN15778_c0_g1_i1.p1  ORF type:complete len:188 (-),score=60.77 TRINITY_DN15778_c0_g1_i1:32-595(-)